MELMMAARLWMKERGVGAYKARVGADKACLAGALLCFSLMSTWQAILVYSVSDLQREIDVLTKRLSDTLVESSDGSSQSNIESQSLDTNTSVNVGDLETKAIKQENDNIPISITDILNMNLNQSDRNDITNLFNSRVKRNDGARGDSQTGAAHRRDSCAKVLNLELSVYARSVEIDTVSQINRWSNMRGPPIDGTVRLTPSSHIQTDGSVRIQHTGLYIVYAQLTFGATRRAHRIGFSIKKNGSSVAKCIDQEHGLDAQDGVIPHAARQCFTSTVLYLSHRDRLTIDTAYPDQSVYPNRDMSFWGLVKLSC